MLQMIKQYFIGSPSYIADPHTAVVLTAAQRVYPKERLINERATRFICRILLGISPTSAVQVTLSTAHPTNFSDAVTKVLSMSQGFDFERPQEFRGLLDKERRVGI